MVEVSVSLPVLASTVTVTSTRVRVSSFDVKEYSSPLAFRRVDSISSKVMDSKSSFLEAQNWETKALALYAGAFSWGLMISRWSAPDDEKSFSISNSTSSRASDSTSLTEFVISVMFSVI